MKRYLSPGNEQIAPKHRKRFSTSSFIREMELRQNSPLFSPPVAIIVEYADDTGLGVDEKRGHPSLQR